MLQTYFNYLKVSSIQGGQIRTATGQFWTNCTPFCVFSLGGTIWGTNNVF